MASGIMDAVNLDRTPRREALTALLVFLVLTAVMTWPAAARPFDVKIDKNFDVAVFWWNLWWIKRAVFNLHTSPFWCDYLLYPDGLNVVFQTPCYLYGILGIPVQALLGLERGIALTTNLVLIGSTALTGWGAWLMARRLTNNVPGAYFAGVAFAFSPFRFWHTGRFHLICTEILIFYILLLWITLEDGKKKHALAAGALFAALVYSSPTYTFYAFLFSLLVAGRFLVVDRRHWPNMLALAALAGVMAFLISLPWLGAALDLIRSNPAGVGKGYAEIVKYSGDLVGYFIPGHSQRLLGLILGGFGDGYPGIHGSEIFLGYTVLLLAFVALVRYARKGAGFWLIGAALFWIISMGPRLKIRGEVYFRLPYELLLKLGPPFTIDRDPCRYVILVSLCLSMAAAFGLKALSGGGRKWASWVVPLLLVAEFFQAPLTMKPIAIPDLYYRMRREGDHYAVLELPMESPLPRRFARIYGTVHQKPMIHSIPRRQKAKYDFVDENRFFGDLYSPAELVAHPDKEVLDFNRRFLVDNKVKYIILHEKVSDPIVYGLWMVFLELHRPVEVIVEPGLRAYRFY